MHVGIFFDRDGTINEEVNYLASPDQLRLIPRAAQALRTINETGWKVFIISNQSGVARGFLTEEQVRIVNLHLLTMLEKEGGKVDDIFYCPHLPGSVNSKYNIVCDCRKPNIGMLLNAAKTYNIDLRRSFVIGDKVTDVETANNAGAGGILVKTGYGLKEMNLLLQNNVTSAYVADDVYDAVQFIKQNFLTLTALA